MATAARTWQVSAILLFAAVIILALPHAAHGQNCGSRAGCEASRCVYVANNQWHAVRFAGLGNSNGVSDIDSKLQTAINRMNADTQMSVYRHDSDPYPDVIAMDNSYPDWGYHAWVQCDGSNTGKGGSHPDKWCRGQELRFNSLYANSYSSYEKQVLAVHELGHTAGLRHWNEYHSGKGSAMYFDAQEAWTSYLTTHDEGEVDDQY